MGVGGLYGEVGSTWGLKHVGWIPDGGRLWGPLLENVCRALPVQGGTFRCSDDVAFLELNLSYREVMG